MEKYYEEIIESLIALKDQLKEDGYSWKTYDCINDACNVLENLVRNEAK